MGSSVLNLHSGYEVAAPPPPSSYRLKMPEGRALTEDQLADFQECFLLFDTKGDGKIPVMIQHHCLFSIIDEHPHHHLIIVHAVHDQLICYVCVYTNIQCTSLHKPEPRIRKIFLVYKWLVRKILSYRSPDKNTV